MTKKIMLHECQTCTAPFSPQRSTAKNCPPCSLLTRIQYARTKKVKRRQCCDCAAVFAPLHVQDHYRCAACAVAEDTGTPEFVVCVLCSHTRPAPDPRVPICLFCAKDPKLRKELLERLLAGKLSRRTLYARQAAVDAAVLALWHRDSPAPAAAPPAPRPERTAKISGMNYTATQLHGIVAKNPLKSARTQQLAAAALADPEHAVWNSDTGPPAT